ncbi:MAG: hypothetical protein LCH85_23860 [Chloroflexi bacterium]|nr:hypothetical protein [Chloroflexota bacterium]
MKYLYWLLLCLMLAGCANAAPQPTPLPPIAPSVQQTIEETIKQTPDFADMHDLAIQAVPGLEVDQLFVLSFKTKNGLIMGILSGWHDQATQQFHSKGSSFYALDQGTEPWVYQASIPDEPFYVVYGYMPNDVARLARIILKNGQVLYFPAESGLRALLVSLSNPAVKVEIVDKTGRVFMEYPLHSK